MNLNDLTVEEIAEVADNPAIFQKGQVCYHRGAVDPFFMSGKGIKAQVEGKPGKYSVEIRTGWGNLTTDCTCAYEGEVCEHIVAVLLYSLLGDPEAEEEDYYPESTAQEQVIPLPVHALEQLLTGQLDFRDLVGLAAQLEKEFARVQGKKTLPNNVIQFPRSKKMTVSELKKQVQDFFRDSQKEAIEEGHIDYDFGYHDAPAYPNLNCVFNQLNYLKLEEQLDVLWYIVTYGNLIFSKTGTLAGTADIAEAVGLFAETVMDLDLKMPQKQVYLNSLIAAFDWPMFLNEELDMALKVGLDTLCTTEEDLRYAIATLQSASLENSIDWVAEAYSILGDEENYLRLCEENLKEPSDYLNLAEHWREEKGDLRRSIAILERWIVDCTPPEQDNVEAWNILYNRSGNDITLILGDLAEYYSEQEDTKNLYHLMMLGLRINGLSIQFYQDLKPVALKLNCWEHCQQQIRMFARDEVDVLAQIYLDQKDWEGAIALAQQPDFSPSVQLAIAQGIKLHCPQKAIALYQQLVDQSIQKKTRRNYQTAAEYVQEIREIYLSLLEDTAGWQEYIHGLRQEYQHYRALQEELEDL